ncbi:MAG: repair protein SbcC/Rad50 [Frankiales bacterium]|jgi:exonuclease SbcC|nr:repair protein SbcC/Rad50 [Frankiales bacterium]
MRPVHLDLDGFGIFRQAAHVDFVDADYFALIGPTGSGKTTVIDGITFALYGTCPRWDDRRIVANALAPTSNRALVRLLFDLRGQRYVIVRELRRTKSGKVDQAETRLERLDDPSAFGGPEDPTIVLAGAADEILDWVEEHVMPYEQFTTCVVLPQGKFADFLHEKPAVREKMLIDLLGLGLYEKLQQMANTRATSNEAAAAALESRLTTLAVTQEEVEAATNRVSNLATLLAQVHLRLPKLERSLKQRDELAEKADQLHDDVAALSKVKPPKGLDVVAARHADAAKVAKLAASAVAKAEKREETARAAVQDAPPREPLATARAAHQEHAVLSKQTSSLRKEVAANKKMVTAASKLLAEAESRQDQAQQHRDHMTIRHAASELRSKLSAGELCPICEQIVIDLPPALDASDLVDAQAQLKEAIELAKAARTELSNAANAHTAAQSAVQSHDKRLAALAQVIGEHPDPKAIDAALSKLDTLAAAHTTALEALSEQNAKRREAEAVLTKTQSELTNARRTLDAVRDPLVALGAPALPEDLVSAWDKLVKFAETKRGAVHDQLTDLSAKQSTLEKTLERQQRELSELLASENLTMDARGLAGVEALVVATHERAIAQVATLKSRQDEHARITAEAQDHRERQQIARTLGRLLGAAQIRRWLLQEGVQVLIADGSSILMELSGGQYELRSDDKGVFEIVDHNDADSLRPVKTLSGGETFQASLALALALSRQLAGISTSHSSLDSIFLDEGFGSLDAATLDTVAATLEGLAAGGDRMVGLVTHVPALADRVPVRYELAKTSTGATVTRTALT